MDDGEPNHYFDDPKVLFCQRYFEAINLVYEDFKHRFWYKYGMPKAASFENVSLKVENSTDVSEEYQEHLHLYSINIDIERFLVQLRMLCDRKQIYNDNNPTTPIKEITNLRTLCEMLNNLSFS